MSRVRIYVNGSSAATGHGDVVAAVLTAAEKLLQHRVVPLSDLSRVRRRVLAGESLVLVRSAP